MSTNKHVYFIVTLLIPLCWQTPVYALKSDKEKPIEVSANNAERDEKLGTTTYNGNVEIKQGTMLIQADKVVIKTIFIEKAAREEINDIVTTGEPSHFQQQIKSEDDLVDATAKTIHYRIQDKKVDLIEDAILKQQGRVITGDKISYDVSAERVIADSKTENRSQPNQPQPKRVTVTIPATPKTSPPPAPASSPQTH